MPCYTAKNTHQRAAVDLLAKERPLEVQNQSIVPDEIQTSPPTKVANKKI